MHLPTLERLLARAGFHLARQGKHRVYTNAQGQRLIVTAHHVGDVKPGTVKAIQKDLRDLGADHG